MVVVAVTDKNHRSAIRRSRKQSLYHRGVGRDRITQEPPKYAWTPGYERGIAEERRRQESVFAVLYKDAGNTEVGDGDDLARISAIRGGAPDGVRCGYDLVPDDRRRADSPQ